MAVASVGTTAQRWTSDNQRIHTPWGGVLVRIPSRQYPQIHGTPGIFAFSRVVVLQHRGRRWFEAMLRLLGVHGFTEAWLAYSFRTNANDFSYYIVSIQFIYLNVRSWFNLFGMIKGGTRDKQCAGGAGKVSCSGDGVQSKSRRKGVLFWCGMWKNEIFGFRNYSRIFRIKLAINWARIVEKIKIQKKNYFQRTPCCVLVFPKISTELFFTGNNFLFWNRGQARPAASQAREAVTIQDMACKSIACRESLRLL